MRAKTKHPLDGKSVLVTRAAEQVGDFERSLRDHGAVPVLFPTIQIIPAEDVRPLDQAIAKIAAYDWIIFTSVNGVRFFFERLAAQGLAPARLHHLRLAAIGPATAAALAVHGLQPDLVPPEYIAESIVAAIGEVSGQRILLPRADIARKALVDGLIARGATVDEVVAYRTIPAEPGTFERYLQKGGTIDIATFTSPSTVHNFVALLDAQVAQAALAEAVIACIGPITARAAEDAGLTVDVIASEHTTTGLIEAVITYIEEQT